MVMETGTISRIVSNAANLQRIQPTSNSGRRKEQNPRKESPKKELEAVADLLYTPDGRIEDEDHGLRIDISA